jgi:hypothetical protein
MEPLSEDLLDMAGKILLKHSTPMITAMPDVLNDNIEDEDFEDSDSEDKADCTEGLPGISATMSGLDPDKDRAHQNLHLLCRDILYVTELVSVISDGDIGRVKDLLPTLAKMFWGAGGNNYCTEIPHFILNLKHIWTPEFAYVNFLAYTWCLYYLMSVHSNIMRDNMLVNVSGLAGHAMPIDLNIEHLIGELKVGNAYCLHFPEVTLKRFYYRQKVSSW